MILPIPAENRDQSSSHNPPNPPNKFSSMILPNTLSSRDTHVSSSSLTSSSPHISSMDSFNSRCIFLINTRSGGRNGWLLGEELKYNGCKVYDLLELHELDQVKAEFASDISNTNCVVGICGGDGSIAWGCSVVSDALRFAPPGKQIFPTITVVPIGTGNDLSRSLGWGNLGVAPRSISSFLANLKTCYETQRMAHLDRWRLKVHTKGVEDIAQEYATRRIELEEERKAQDEEKGSTNDDDDATNNERPPSSVTSVDADHIDRPERSPPSSRDSADDDDEDNEDNDETSLGHPASSSSMSTSHPPPTCSLADSSIDLDEDTEFRYSIMNEFSPPLAPSFLCYLSIGYDARVAFEFQQERYSHPERFKSQFGNQMIYIKYGFNELFKPSDHINDHVALSIDGTYIELPPRTRSLKFVNINSAANGIFFWGHGPSRSNEFEEMNTPRLDDGRIEVMATRGVTDLIAHKVNMTHAHRLGQGKEIKLTIFDPIALQVDGEGYMITPCCLHISRLDGLPTLIGYENPRGVDPLFGGNGGTHNVEEQDVVGLHGSSRSKGEQDDEKKEKEKEKENEEMSDKKKNDQWSLDGLEWFQIFKSKLEKNETNTTDTVDELEGVLRRSENSSGDLKRYHSMGTLLNQKEIHEFEKILRDDVPVEHAHTDVHQDNLAQPQPQQQQPPSPMEIDRILDFSNDIGHPVDI